MCVLQWAVCAWIFEKFDGLTSKLPTQYFHIDWEKPNQTRGSEESLAILRKKCDVAAVGMPTREHGGARWPTINADLHTCIQVLISIHWQIDQTVGPVIVRAVYWMYCQLLIDLLGKNISSMKVNWMENNSKNIMILETFIQKNIEREREREREKK